MRIPPILIAAALTAAALACTACTGAAPPSPPLTVSRNYADLIQRSIHRDYPGMLHQPTGSLAFPFVTPGSVYASELWDWDSWLSDVALCQILTDEGADKKKTVLYGEGCVLNFLAAAAPDGYIPIMIKSRARPATQPTPPNSPPTDTNNTNMHKPVLAQHAAFLTKLAGGGGEIGDAEWLRAKFPTLQAFIKNYHDHRRHAATGLYFWTDDLAIGVDNDPATFFRPNKSSGNIFLNCLMVKELQAMAYLARSLKLDTSVADDYDHQAADLKAAIQKNCWDERDGYFYSVDLNLRPYTGEPGNYLGSRFVLHSGHPRDYDCLIQRLEGWSGFMAMWAGVATPEQARRMVNEHLHNPKTLGAPFGIRTLSKMEKMYAIYPSSNPSDWDGPIWGISNYIVFRGLLNYGFTADAQDMLAKTVNLYGQDYAKNNALHEYYDPDSGQPIINKGFQNWNYLVTNMLAWQEHRPVITEF